MPVDHTITHLDTISRLQGRDVVMIFGKTRAGKSTFINDAYRTRILESKTSMLSDTHTISFVEPPLQVDGSKVYLVDTIGLGGSEALENRMMLASQWTCIFCPDPNSIPGKSRPVKKGPLHPTVKGFFYFIDITDAAGLNEDNQLNLDFFKRLVGTEVLESVIFVTTKWAPPRDRTRRVQETRFREWEKKINDQFPGAQLMRLDDSTSRWSDEELAEMPVEEAEEEKARYHENSMAAFRLLLKKPATSATSLETEIEAAGESEGTMEEIGIVNVAIEEARSRADSLDRVGEHIQANLFRSTANQLATTRVNDAVQGYREKGNAILGVLCMNEAQRRALENAYYESMVPRMERFPQRCAEIGAEFGEGAELCGKLVGTGLALLINAADTIMILAEHSESTSTNNE